MVKADPKRNYYADLELPPDADAEEIRKQFRKLALKWHPDRNPGREAECVPRFQAIQAAHEILGDPAERTRYDLERRKRGSTATYTPRQPAPRGNPYQARSDFPPPPRRTGPQRPQPPPRPDFGTASASAGAGRYTNFPKPPPTQRRDNASGDQKANVFTAWQSMKGKTGTHPPRTGHGESSHQRAKSAWEYANEQQKPGVNRSQSTRVPKRGGFDPATPGADEPPAASTSSYFTTSNYGRPVPPPPPPPRDAGATNPAGARQPPVDPLKQFREQFQKESAYPEGMRTRTPYNATGGEKIFVDPVRRSASQRSSPHREHDAAGASVHGATGARHHSASPPRRKGNATRPFSMYSSSEEDDPPKPRQKASQPGQQGSTGVNGSATHSSSTNGPQVNGGMGQKSKSSIFTFPIDTDTFASTSPEQPKSKSAESINTIFSPAEWHGKFEGKPDYFTSPMPPTGNRAKKSPSRPPSSRKNSTQNYASAAANQMPQPSPQPTEQPAATPSAGAPPPSTPGAVKFSSEEWAKTFKDPSFVLPADVPAKTSSPTKGPAPMRGRKQSRSRGSGPNIKPRQASVADAEDESNESVASANETAATDGSAMDIDPTPPAPQTNGTQRPRIVPTPISQARVAQREQAQAQDQAKAPEDDGTLRFNEFANVAPFTSTSQEGLRDLNDLTQNLPFESRPAASHPVRSAEPAALRLPEVPKAPELPQRLTMSAWGEYLPKMAAYVRAFRQFDSHMLQHFAAREHETDAMGSPANWLGAMGDTMSGGFNSYMRGIREDERARAHWDIGWQKHKDAMELFEGCRARVLKGGLPA
ncbi:hypothetical protein B0J12DRAFT_52442 [Macrophomina phaseolina]|uniref:J domain-containing protein n=1 Tax=Macrophomina phaseolina TaxID=35725 RepID=A0ABQ8GH49_9PEZI|nr:hypothetical protein B0J12DRAFT_52442 [Macrophomina phaseolina]